MASLPAMRIFNLAIPPGILTSLIVHMAFYISPHYKVSSSSLFDSPTYRARATAAGMFTSAGIVCYNSDLFATPF